MRTSYVPLVPARTSARWIFQAFDWVIGDKLITRAQVRRASDSVWSEWSVEGTSVAP